MTRNELTIETLKNGGYFWGSKGFDYFGKPIVKITLMDADHNKVKGIGEGALMKLVNEDCMQYVERPGEYSDPIEMLKKLRGFIYGKYILKG